MHTGEVTGSSKAGGGVVGDGVGLGAGRDVEGRGAMFDGVALGGVGVARAATPERLAAADRVVAGVGVPVVLEGRCVPRSGVELVRDAVGNFAHCSSVAALPSTARGVGRVADACRVVMAAHSTAR